MRRRSWLGSRAGRRRGWFLVAPIVSLFVVAAARPARGDGAFPDSLQILLPSDRPNVIGLATNFGLILTEDAGQTWQWICEVDALRSANLYQVGPAPLDRFFASSGAGIVSSDDLGCHWPVSGGRIAGAVGRDVFPDPSNPDHVLGIAQPFGGATNGPFTVFESIDAGLTFDRILFQVTALDAILGVEVAATDAQVVYVAWSSGPGVHPKLSRTFDGAATWETIDLEPMIGASFVRIIAVDRHDPRRIFLRIQGSGYEELAISDDAGTTLASPLHVVGQLGGFAVLPSGTIVVGGVMNEGSTRRGIAFGSLDGGLTFEAWPTAPRVRALAQRDGALFIAGDDASDGFALAVSGDEGATLTPLMSYRDVAAIKPCVTAACVANCRYESSLGLWPPSVCGAFGTDAGLDGGPGVINGPPRGCGCTTSGGTAPGGAAVVAVLLALAASSRRRRPARRS